MEPTRRRSEKPLALITGASSGLGETFARKLAAAGYDLVLVARRLDRMEKLAAELRTRYGVEAECLAADLADDEQLRRVEERIARASNLEFLVNNAGFGTLPLFYEADPASQDRMHRVHVLATVRLTRAALPIFVARKKGFLVNVSSVAGFLQGPGNVSYCSTKAWMNSFTEGLAIELERSGADVRVQALCPGFTKTEFHDVLGIGRGFASPGWWMTADAVVDASLEGLRRKKLFVIPGFRYKLIVFITKALPRFLLHALLRRSPSSRERQIASGKQPRSADGGH